MDVLGQNFTQLACTFVVSLEVGQYSLLGLVASLKHQILVFLTQLACTFVVGLEVGQYKLLGLVASLKHQILIFFRQISTTTAFENVSKNLVRLRVTSFPRSCRMQRSSGRVLRRS